MNDQNQTDRNQTCGRCKWLITIPPYWIGECSIHEAPHKQKEYCPDWQPLRREVAYCKPTCELNGRLKRERPANTLIEYPQSGNLSTFPPGSLLKQEIHYDEAVPGAPLYMVVAWNEVVKLDPKTRSRTACDIPGITSMCLVTM